MGANELPLFFKFLHFIILKACDLPNASISSCKHLSKPEYAQLIRKSTARAPQIIESFLGLFISFDDRSKMIYKINLLFQISLQSLKSLQSFNLSLAFGTEPKNEKQAHKFAAPDQFWHFRKKDSIIINSRTCNHSLNR